MQLLQLQQNRFVHRRVVTTACSEVVGPHLSSFFSVEPMLPHLGHGGSINPTAAFPYTGSGVRRPLLAEPPTNDIETIEVFVDSDWAKDKGTRKSTSGGVICVLGVPVLTYSRTQSTVALSSGEAEFYAICSGACEAIFVKNSLSEMKIDAKIRMKSDSVAGRAMASRTGVGKVKHLELKHLRVQEALRAKRIVVVKEHTTANVADLMTKHLSEAAMLAHLRRAGCEFREGRPEGAPQLEEGTVRQRVAMVVFGGAE